MVTPSIDAAAIGAAGVFRKIGLIVSIESGEGLLALLIISASSRSPQAIGLNPTAELPARVREDSNNLVIYVLPTPVSVPVMNRFTIRFRLVWILQFLLPGKSHTLHLFLLLGF